MTKAGYVINPKTNRPVKIGGRSWMKAIKDGFITAGCSTPDDDNVLYDIQEDDNIEELRHEFNEKLGDNIEVARGRGRYKNKLVKRKKKISTAQMKEYATNTAIQAVKENMDELQGYDDDELERELERIINEEMMTGTTLKKVKQRKARENNKHTQFKEIVQSDEYEEEEDEEEEEEDDDGGY
jgi:hypothetical protein